MTSWFLEALDDDDDDERALTARGIPPRPDLHLILKPFRRRFLHFRPQ
jgi:hypothetical protein